MNRYDLVLLGLILEKDCCGYDIITEIRKRELDRWAKISTSTVYTRLAKLEKTGYILGHIEREGNRPERTVYSLAEKGHDLFRKEVVRHLTGFNDDPRTLGFAFLYGIDSIVEFKLLKEENIHVYGCIFAFELLFIFITSE